MDRHRAALSRTSGGQPGRPHGAALGRPVALALALPALAFLGLFFVWPVLGILRVGLAPEGRLDTARLLEAWTRPWLPDVILFTLALAAVSTVLTLLAGLPAAWVFARRDFPGRRLARALVTVPFVMPTVVVGAAFLALLGPRNPLNEALVAWLGADAPQLRLDGSVVAILVAHVFYNVAVVIRLVGGLWEHLDPRAEEAARMLGASPWRVLREVSLPLLGPAIWSAASIVFLFTVTSFGVVLLLGSAAQTTLEVEIYRQTAILLDLPTAAALVVIQVAGIFVLLVLSARAQERMAHGQRLRASAETLRPVRTPRERLLVGLVLGGLCLLLVMPLVVLVERSLATPGGYGVDAYASLLETGPHSRLFVPPAVAVGNSLSFATATALLAGTLGLLAGLAIGHGRGWLPRTFDALIMLPLGTSAVVVGFGFLVTLREPPLDLRTSTLIIPIAHGLVALPFVMRAVVPLVRSIDVRLREAAAVLGASPRRTWLEVDAPILARAALLGGTFAFAVSLGEFGATLFISRPDTPTVPVTIYRLLGLPGATNFGSAMALSTVLMLLTALSVLLIERARGSGPQAF